MLPAWRARCWRIRLILILVLLPGLPGVTAAVEDDADTELGRQIFVEVAEPQCSICHVLADAEANGAIGPNLDVLRPTKQQVEEAVRSGPGVMPAYSDSLSDDEIEALAEYVSRVAGQ